MAFSTIQGSGANDATSFVGTSGIDAIALVNNDGNFTLGAQQGADVITFTDSGNNNYGGVINASTIKGGAGADTLSTNGNARGMALVNGFINLNADADTLTLRAADTASATTIKGGQGADTLAVGVFSASLLNGNKDNDTVNLNANSAGSTIRGGQGNDSINVNANFTSALIAGDNGTDNINDGGGTRVLTSTTIQGNAGNDTLNFTNQTTAVTIRGGADNDTITSGTAADTILGDNGNDSIVAAAGNDTITTGAGIDTVRMAASTAFSATGFAGANSAAGDTITFANGVDIVTDFVAGTDRIDAATAGAAAITGLGRATANGFTAANYAISGSFNATTGVFTAAADNAGTDTLLFNGAGAGNSFANTTNHTILQGVSQNLGFALV